MKERGIIFSVTTGKPSLNGQRLRSKDGLTWKQRNRLAVNARRRALYAKEPEKHRKRAARYRIEARPNVLRLNRRWSVKYRARLRAEMIVAYGGECRCCGERERLFLQLDHVNNDGHLDKKAHRTSNKLLAHLKRKGWPKDRYQLLCANCNFGKRMNGGVCPHANIQS